jgi:putative FmdB family regulatory protein
MPLYNFKCPQCKNHLDLYASMQEIGVLNPHCPECKVRLLRQYGAGVALHVKHLPADFGKGTDARQEKILTLRSLEEQGKISKAEMKAEYNTLKNDPDYKGEPVKAYSGYARDKSLVRVK